MAAYVISDVLVRNSTAIEVYRRLAAASIARYSGRHIVSGGAFEVLEGSWMPRPRSF